MHFYFNNFVPQHQTYCMQLYNKLSAEERRLLLAQAGVKG